MKISIIGDGGWGTTLSRIIESSGHNTVLWCAFPENADAIKKTGQNEKFLPGVDISENIMVTSNIADTEKSDHYIFAVPCQYMRSVANRFKGTVRSKVINASKGIEHDSLKRPVEVLQEIFGEAEMAVISGPTIAYEVARNMPTTCVVASKHKKLAEDMQNILKTDYFRIYTSEDVIGVELGGAIKNVIAIAAGIADGMGFGVNTKSAILTRGLAEITRLGLRAGASKETFTGLSGVGDLATTCMSDHSRNRWFGEEIGKGRDPRSITEEIEMVVEGVATAKSAFELAKKMNVEMPITEQIYRVIYEGKDPSQAVKELMTRSPKSE